MGLSNQGWRPPLTWNDLEFQNGRLVKVRGSRPMYMDGYVLQHTLMAVAEMLFYEKTLADHLQDKYIELANLTPMPGITMITVPTNADEAEAMQKLGMAWLVSNAPERLTEKARQQHHEANVKRHGGNLSPDADPGGDTSGQE